MAAARDRRCKQQGRCAAADALWGILWCAVWLWFAARTLGTARRILACQQFGTACRRAIYAGARALRAIIEEFMLDIMYEIPKDDNIGSVEITRAYIEKTGGPVISMRMAGHLPDQNAKKEKKHAENAAGSENHPAND